jgi:hypothetical protein
MKAGTRPGAGSHSKADVWLKPASATSIHQDYGSISITFGNYIKQLVKIGISASLALGVVFVLLFLIVGETTAEIDLTLEFEALDGIWFLIGLPIITTLVFLLLSPLSYGIHRFLDRLFRDQPRDEV